MYRVLLVDDEPWALRGIRESFAWAELSFSVIAETTRPVEALEVILSQKPDAVFTDIRMPGFSGIELMQQATEKGSDCEFIVISGFSEFTYAQEALRLSAFDYCLKPLELDYAAKLLKRLREHLDARRNSRDMALLDALIEGRGGLQQLLEKHGFDCSKDFFQVAVVISGNQQLISFPNLSCNCIWIGAGQHKQIVIVNGDCGPLGEALPRCAVGISTVSGSVDDIARLVAEAEIAAGSRFIHCRDGLYPYQKKNIAAANPFLENLMSLADKNKPGELKKAIEDIPKYFRFNNLGLEDLVYLWNQVAATAARRAPEAACETGMEFLNAEQLLQQFEDIESLCDNLYQGLSTTEDKTAYSHDASSGQNKDFSKLLLHIQKHYEEQLFLRELARDFYINHNYCCFLFKKHTGSTFSDYINRIRMEKSRELLRNNDLTIDEVAQKVGYNDYFYFIRVFKKYNGITPSKYRKEVTGA